MASIEKVQEKFWTIGVERRKHPRELVETTAVIRPAVARRVQPGEAFVATVFDLSRVGVGFSVRKPLGVGDVFRVSACERIGSASRAQVMNCRPRTDGLFDIGAAFC